MENEFDIKNFITERDNVLIAPAGFGKTHTIKECLKHTEGRQLILTHTQAGVASIKDKLQKENVSKEKYELRTITSFTGEYVFSFYHLNNVPDEADDNYYEFIIDNAIRLFSSKLVQEILKFSYSGIFVDEYQDCTEKQHKLILILANIIPTHILGDPLQGIFNFNKKDKLVDLNNASQMGRFKNISKLKMPYRWINSGKRDLGEDILKIRNKLESNLEIDFLEYSSIEFKKGTYFDNYKYIFNVLESNKNVLVVDPASRKMGTRKMFVVAFKHIVSLIEAFDGRDFYRFAKLLDNENNLEFKDILYEIIVTLFSKLDNWYNKTTKEFKKKTNPQEEEQLVKIKQIINKIEENCSLIDIKNLILEIKNLEGVNCARRDLLNSLIKSIEEANNLDITVLEAMRRNRNSMRIVGRKMYGKFIGTTLLTKGLEFDVVIILDVNKFNDCKNLYVALSRCTTRLIVLGESSKINF